MGRLTFEGDFCEIASCLEVKGGAFCKDEPCSQRKVWDRLKEYEDTGMSPEDVIYAKDTLDNVSSMYGLSIQRILEITKADKEDRLVALPCKIGDNAWVIRNVRGVKRAMFGVVAEMYFSQEMRLIVRVHGIGRGEVGKTVFLTFAEAMAATRKGGQKP